MRVRAALKWVFAFGALAVAAGPAGAQPLDPAGGVAPPPPAATDAQVGFQRKVVLSPQEQMLEADRHVAKMEAFTGSLGAMLQEARKARDVVKTLCLSDKLSQVDVAVRSGKERRGQLRVAIDRADTELANHEFTIITVLRQRTEQLVAEANSCIGEESAFIGDTRTTTEVDPQIAQDEASYPATDPVSVVGPPQCASCTL